MFNWVVKVVPQPAEALATDADAKTVAAEPPKRKEVKNGPQKTPEEASEDGQPQPGVMGWLSNGFVSALPQPPGSPLLSRANSDARPPGEDGERSGVISWVTQGLTKVLPQPEGKYREAIEILNTPANTEEHTEVFDAATMPDYDPLPHIPVVEMVSEAEESEVEPLNPQFPPNVVNWIKHMIPQPVILPPGAVPIEPPPKTSRLSLDKILSPPPESLSGISLDTDSKTSGVVDWFVSGLGLKMPQLVITPKDDSQGAAEVLQKASSKLKPDMVLEDVESDNEGQQNCAPHTKAAVPATSTSPPTVAAQQQQCQETQPAPSGPVQPLERNDATLEVPPGSDAKISQEDAETQTGRWTPFIESIKREAEDVALATMEERLLQERMEMARLAEEVARQTAEMAVRQMASEGTSIKLSLESQELLEEPEAELPVPQEEEEEEEEGKSNVEPRGDTEKEESLVQDEQKVETEEATIREPEAPSPQQENIPDPDPAPEAGPDPQPVTQQPQKAENTQSATTDKEADSTGDGCGDSSTVSLRPAVNVEDVDNQKAGAGGGGKREETSEIPSIQDPKLTTLTVPVTPSGGRQSKGDKE